MFNEEWVDVNSKVEHIIRSVEESMMAHGRLGSLNGIPVVKDNVILRWSRQRYLKMEQADG